jgi:hypothetical protein
MELLFEGVREEALLLEGVGDTGFPRNVSVYVPNTEWGFWYLA